jgi:uncharacterized protein (DUF488 family)
MTDIYTIGHSTRSLDEFLAILTSFKPDVLVDVRRYPHSRRHPHFNTDELKKALFHVGVKYDYMGDSLGGYRTKKKDSPHLGLRESSFQGYADHMETPIFRKGFERLLALATTQRVVYMCSESNYKSCHRRMISDAMTLLAGVPVHHIVGVGGEIPHEPFREARIDGARLLYAPRPLEEFEAAKTARNDTRS